MYVYVKKEAHPGRGGPAGFRIRNGRAEGTSPVGGASPLNGYQSSWTGEMERKIKVVFIMMLVLIEQHIKCVMMNKGHKMMPY